MYSLIKATSGAFPVLDDLYLIDAVAENAVAIAKESTNRWLIIRHKHGSYYIMIDVYPETGREDCTILYSDEHGRYIQAVRVITKNHPRWCATLAGWVMMNINKMYKIEHQFESVMRENQWIEPLPDVPAVWYRDEHTDSLIIVQA